MQRMNMYEVTGWDGGTIFDYNLWGNKGELKAGPSGYLNQSTWYYLVNKNSDNSPMRLRYGMRKFYQKNKIWIESEKYRDNIVETDRVVWQ